MEKIAPKKALNKKKMLRAEGPAILCLTCGPWGLQARIVQVRHNDVLGGGGVGRGEWGSSFMKIQNRSPAEGAYILLIREKG